MTSVTEYARVEMEVKLVIMAKDILEDIKEFILNNWGKRENSLELDINGNPYVIEVRNNVSASVIVRNKATGREYLVGIFYNGKHVLVQYVLPPSFEWEDSSWHEVIHEALCCVGAKDVPVAWNSELESLSNEAARWYVLSSVIKYLNSFKCVS